jgi:hypothetical protein
MVLANGLPSVRTQPEAPAKRAEAPMAEVDYHAR